MTNPYDAVFKKSIEDPNGFWAEAAEDCHWYKNGTKSSTTPTSHFTAGLREEKSIPVTMPWIFT